MPSEPSRIRASAGVPARLGAKLASWVWRRRSADDGLARAKQALGRGETRQAVQDLEAALDRAPARRDVRLLLAKLLRELGDRDREIDVWKALADQFPDDPKAHDQLHKLLFAAGRTAEAEPHLLALARLNPRDRLAWRRLAFCRRELGQVDAEIEAWRRLIALDPGDQKASARLLELAMASETDAQSGAALAALPRDIGSKDARTTGEADPRKTILALRAAARRLAALERVEAAHLAWLRLRAWDPTNLEAMTQVEEAELYGHAAAAPGRGPRARPKLLVIGNCQAYGVARRLRHACPDLEVRAVGLAELTDDAARAAMLSRHADAEWIATQPLNHSHGVLATDALAAEGRAVVRFPRVNFRGLHPDLLGPYAEVGGLAWRGNRSAIVAAAYAMDLPELRAAELFNAYVYGVLGYFDLYPKAEAHLVGEARRCGMDIAPALRDWLAQGAFMHVPVHPKPIALDWLARQIAGRLGVASRPPDAEPSDVMAPFGSWPVYPEIARRLGLRGSMIFHPGALKPKMGLRELIAHGYRDYARFPRELVLERMAPMVERLRREGV